MFENLIAALKADKRKIVFTEGPDARILEAAARLKKDGLMDSILVGCKGRLRYRGHGDHRPGYLPGDGRYGS